MIKVPVGTRVQDEDTRELIGAEKAGVLRPGQIVILGEDMPQAVFQACKRHEVQPRVLGVDVHVARAEEARAASE